VHSTGMPGSRHPDGAKRLAVELIFTVSVSSWEVQKAAIDAKLDAAAERKALEASAVPRRLL